MINFKFKSKNEKDKIAREQNKILGTQFLAFMISFLIIYLFVIGLINLFFFKEISIELSEQKESIVKNISESMEHGNKRINIGPRTNARIHIILYDEEKIVAFDSSILVYILKEVDISGSGFKTIEEYENFIKENKVFSSNLFQYREHGYSHSEMINLNENYYFQTLSFAISNEAAPNIKYCKLLIMTNGEVSSRNQVIKIFTFSAFLMFAFAFIASMISSNLSIKPVKQALDKQVNFVNDASHELRTPLAIVQNKLENILAKSDKTVYEVSSDIAVSLNEIMRLSKLTNDLLTLANSDNENLKLNYEVFDLFDLVKTTAAPFQEMAIIEGKIFEIIGSSVMINADRSKISQVIIILLDNALKYTTTNDTIRVEMNKNINEVNIIVSDTGIGIDDEGKRRVFERFYRADKARSRETGGNGLGLSIAKTITNAHRGIISVSDNYPKGTKFEVKLLKAFKIEKK